MADVEVRDILLRCGGRTLHRTGFLAAMGAGRGYVEVKETFTRADAATCRTFIDRDVGAGQILRLAEANKVRIEYPPALSGLVDAFGYPYCGPLLEGTRQNLIENCDYEVDIVGSAVKGGSTLVRDNAHALRGSWALKMTVANAATSGVSFTKRDGSRMAGIAGTTYAGSAWVYATGAAVGGNLRVFVDWFDAGSAYLSTSNGGPTITLVQGWQRIGGLGALAPASAVTAIPYLVTNSGSGIWDAWVDVPQWEVGAFMSSAIPTGTGAVTGSADSLTLPFNQGPIDMTVLARFAKPVYTLAGIAPGGSPGLVAIGDPAFTVPAINVLIQNGVTAQCRAEVIRASGVSNSSGTSNMAAGNDGAVVAQFEAFAAGPLCRADAGTGFGTDSAAPAAMTAFSAQKIVIGDRLSPGFSPSAFPLTGVIFDVIIARGKRTRPEMLAIP